MMSLLHQIKSSPLLVRVVPFVLFAALTTLQGSLGESPRYWIYLAKTVLGAGLIWWIRPAIPEMRWAISWEAVLAGGAVFAVWVGLDGLYPRWGDAGKPWNPQAEFGAGSGLAGFFILVRLAGSALVVPPLEEVFYRSFFYRYVAKADFQSLPLNYLSWRSFLVTAVIFGVVHPGQWLAGVLCACAYQALVIWKKRLGDAMTAHAITNCLLGLWVVWKGAWHFW